MADLNEVFEYVRLHLVDLSSVTTDEKDIDLFLESLKKSTKLNCQKLLVCIGIDLKAYLKHFGHKNVACNCYIDKLREVMLNAHRYPIKLKSSIAPVSPSVNFAIYLSKSIDACCPDIEANNSPKYVRISSFRNFLKFIILDNKTCNTYIDPSFDIDEEEKFLSLYFENDEMNKLNMKKLSGKNGWVFVGERDSLEKLIIAKDIKSLLDSVGFYTGNINKAYKYISLNYPNAFVEKCYQPSSIFGDWGNVNDTGNEFFMTYKEEDCWGRSFSVTGNLKPEKERIHKAINLTGSNTYEFSVVYLGELGETISKATNVKIIEEALNRFEYA